MASQPISLNVPPQKKNGLLFDLFVSHIFINNLWRILLSKVCYEVWKKNIRKRIAFSGGKAPSITIGGGWTTHLKNMLVKMEIFPK